MIQTERKLVEKLEELIKLYERIFQTDTLSLPKCDKIISEIASLKQQIAEEEITDADIEAFVVGYKIEPSDELTRTYDEVLRLGAIIGSKAMRDGKIKHIKNQ
jgi:hypothetical protein